MSENDRMDRAKRIRQMREGQREETDADNDPDGASKADRQPDETPSGPPDQQPPEAGSNGDRTAEEETPNADQPGRETETPAVDDGDPQEGEVPGAVETVSGTTAEVPSTEEMEAAMEQTMEQAEPAADDAGAGESAAAPAGIAEEATTTEDATRVLEFTLTNEQYCLDIEYIEEIVKDERITRVPNTPEFVEGVVDLRGQITTILNPKVVIGKDDTSRGELIVVFDVEAFDDQGHIGWVVDDVSQVSPVTDDQVNDPPMGEDYINGVIDREDGSEFVIWTTPDLALDEAE